MKKTQNGFVVPLILTIVVILALVAIGIYYLSDTKKDLGFKIKYSNEWSEIKSKEANLELKLQHDSACTLTFGDNNLQELSSQYDSGSNSFQEETKTFFEKIAKDVYVDNSHFRVTILQQRPQNGGDTKIIAAFIENFPQKDSTTSLFLYNSGAALSEECKNDFLSLLINGIDLPGDLYTIVPGSTGVIKTAVSFDSLSMDPEWTKTRSVLVFQDQREDEHVLAYIEQLNYSQRMQLVANKLYYINLSGQLASIDLDSKSIEILNLPGIESVKPHAEPHLWDFFIYDSELYYFSDGPCREGKIDWVCNLTLHQYNLISKQHNILGSEITSDSIMGYDPIAKKLYMRLDGGDAGLSVTKIQEYDFQTKKVTTVVDSSRFGDEPSDPKIKEIEGKLSGQLDRLAHIEVKNGEIGSSQSFFSGQYSGIRYIQSEPVTSPETSGSKETDYALYNMSMVTSFVPIKYMFDGTITTGQYTGYEKVVALRIEGEIGEGVYYDLFITKDHKNFYYVAQESSRDMFEYLDNSKVIGKVSGVELNHPKVIDLGDFVMYRQDYYPASNLSLLLSLENLRTGSPPVELQSKYNGLQFFEKTDIRGTSEVIEAEHILGPTELKVRDAHGLVYPYVLVSKENYLRRLQAKQEYFADPFYEITDFADSFPSYKSYDQPFPHVCGRVNSSGMVLKNTPDSSLVPLGKTLRGVQIYKYIGDALNQAQYRAKITNIYEAQYPQAKVEAEKMNGAPEPTYSEYNSKNPLIVVKDPWGRLVLLGEFDYLMPGGCGKPVIYLYPETPTEVKVTLENPVRFTKDIPTYNNGWSVLANPNGVLKDLQPQFTKCESLTSAFGSEYAVEACRNNGYPYLYWAGQVNNEYPKASAGWIVAYDELRPFLDSKLSIVGLNEKERSDMLEYWLPVLEARNAPFYRLSLFQTKDMNSFVPMKIVPVPDTLIRVFLDWEELESDNIKIEEQNIIHTDRVGFTAVEWGGLKK